MERLRRTGRRYATNRGRKTLVAREMQTATIWRVEGTPGIRATLKTLSKSLALLVLGGWLLGAFVLNSLSPVAQAEIVSADEIGRLPSSLQPIARDANYLDQKMGRMPSQSFQERFQKGYYEEAIAHATKLYPEISPVTLRGILVQESTVPGGRLGAGIKFAAQGIANTGVQNTSCPACQLVAGLMRKFLSKDGTLTSEYANSSLPMGTSAKGIADSFGIDPNSLSNEQLATLQKVVTSDAGAILASAASLHQRAKFLGLDGVSCIANSEVYQKIIAGGYGPVGPNPLGTPYNPAGNRTAIAGIDTYGPTIYRLGQRATALSRGLPDPYPNEPFRNQPAGFKGGNPNLLERVWKLGTQ
jgi:hypothetical protein